MHIPYLLSRSSLLLAYPVAISAKRSPYVQGATGGVHGMVLTSKSCERLHSFPSLLVVLASTPMTVRSPSHWHILSGSPISSSVLGFRLPFYMKKLLVIWSQVFGSRFAWTVCWVVDARPFLKKCNCHFWEEGFSSSPFFTLFTCWILCSPDYISQKDSRKKQNCQFSSKDKNKE